MQEPLKGESKRKRGRRKNHEGHSKIIKLSRIIRIFFTFLNLNQLASKKNLLWSMHALDLTIFDSNILFSCFIILVYAICYFFFGDLAKASMYQVHGSANLNVLLQPSFMWTGKNKCSQTHTLHNVPQNAARQLIHVMQQMSSLCLNWHCFHRKKKNWHYEMPYITTEYCIVAEYHNSTSYIV